MNIIIRNFVYGYAYQYGPLSCTLTSMIERLTTAYNRQGGDSSFAMFISGYLDFKLSEVNTMLIKGSELLPIE